MGLDMYLKARVYVSGWEHRVDPRFAKLVDLVGIKPVDDCPFFDVNVPVGYWRKANAIHRWFVTNVQDGKDDCEAHYVDSDELARLRDVCRSVLADPAQAESLLPTQDGFFFGTTAYGEEYFDDLRRTVKIIDTALELTDVDGFQYESSW